MSRTHEELEQEVMTQYRELARALKTTMVGSAWLDMDLTIAQLRTLLILAEEGPLVIGQIAQYLGIGLSTGGHLVDRLVQAGLAERAEDTSDRRRTLARLTSRGEDLYGCLLNRVQHMQTLIHKLNDDDLAALLQGLHALNQAVADREGNKVKGSENGVTPRRPITLIGHNSTEENPSNGTNI